MKLKGSALREVLKIIQDWREVATKFFTSGLGAWGIFVIDIPLGGEGIGR